MQVLLTGANGRVGTAVDEHLGETYDWTYLDREDTTERETLVADITDFEAIQPAFEGQDAVVHLAGDPAVGATWRSCLENNVVGTYNVLEAASQAGVERVVFASSNHVVAGWEDDHLAELWDGEMVIDRHTPRRPDSFYGVSKAFGEDLGRYYIDQVGTPARFYALRIGGLLEPAYDSPYGYAEKARDRGEFEYEPGTEEYREYTRRTEALWLSRRDAAHLVDCCLRADARPFGAFYGVSDNSDRWFDLEDARAAVGYDPADDAADYEPPA
jgi:NAD+ dependent glucose-6-phosphate dehydrogenase